MGSAPGSQDEGLGTNPAMHRLLGQDRKGGGGDYKNGLYPPHSESIQTPKCPNIQDRIDLF